MSFEILTPVIPVIFYAGISVWVLSVGADYNPPVFSTMIVIETDNFSKEVSL